MKQPAKPTFTQTLRWRAAQLVEQTGKLPLMLSILPLGLLGIWLGITSPQLVQQQAELATLQQQLRPLPLLESPVSGQKLSQNEHQQVSLIFELLDKPPLRVEASRYQVIQQGDNAVLQLDIPLTGPYLPLMQALETLSRTLPLQIEQLTMQRPSPQADMLNVTLRLHLQQEAK
ncbi:hypothetical protein [Mixta mediterraneensis]|mgnify:CR=1 FL=1|uniref:hypothetical protein n=1 Tax=Mixta mediterraneensis TaxID=2758443 RepID=UPI0018761D9F|nr:hypothetical protein [Mixta mediterraneensis]MBE5254497.1 hypothetical protein [Mixta mediterraneensis]